MIMNKMLFTFILILFSSTFIYAQDKKVKRPETYNYQRAMEALNKENEEEALEYFNKELAENPENGYAFTWIASIRFSNKDNGRALKAVEQALKFLPKKDAEFTSSAYGIRASIYLALEDTVKALDDISKAINIYPKLSAVYERRADIYFEQQKYDLADADYQQLINLDPSNSIGYMGIGRNRKQQKRWSEAIDKFDYVIKLYPDYSSAYSFRAESYIGLKDWGKAADDIIKALSIDGDNKAFHLMGEMGKEGFLMMEAKLKIQQKKQPNDASWPYYLGNLQEDAKHYKKAIEYYKKALDLDANSILAERIGVCYSELGAMKSALEYVNIAQDLDSEDYDLVQEKADYLYYDGQADAAIAELTRFIDHYPDFHGGYYRRGFFEDNSRKIDEAIEDYSMSIALEPDYAYAYLGRGDMYMLKGIEDLAMADYKKVVELDTIPGTSSCASYAFLALGEKEKALAFDEKCRNKFPDDAGVYYDAACLAGRMSEYDKAVGFIRQSFEKGFRRFHHLASDDDMDALREMPEFISLVDEYKQKFAEENGDEEKAVQEGKEEIVEIPFTKDGGVFSVKCNINNLPLYFIFDTGASDVSLSMVEANFMMKNGYLDKKDVVGTERYVDAVGNISEGTTINIREVDFGGLKLQNVRASVVRNQKAPLLLGQTVLSKLGKIEIDNEARVLKIKHRVK